MVVRHLVLAVLCASASLAQAGVVDSTSSAPRPAWSFGATAMPAAIDPVQPLEMAGPGTWTTYGRYGDRGGISVKAVFTGNGPRAADFSVPAPAPEAAPVPAPAVAAAPPPKGNGGAPAAGGVFTNGPADTSSLGNGGVTGGPSAPPPFTDVLPGNNGHHDDDTAVVVPPASDILDVIVAPPAEPVSNVDVPAAAAVAVPEPATGMLMLAGMLGAGALSRRRRK